ncbi:ATP-binding cassette domain-containing protein [Sulfolobus sp. E5-1-F]|uniref:ABC transporter ATP-binding protein n=1 Tax=Saccharolobus sp. E5-1-F TaxID=2663019 RepID=UPI0012969A77|nr:ABC transporter ATP-binding protein [Sulfolobus sp. E5-1-F]QGA53906.1 ATP-binding cassette domain-containing protein [Sulfolobus sp. E5-1-F]
MIEVLNVSKKYGNFLALQDVTFTINNGELVGYVGLNGAGKTTTIEIIAGVSFPSSGDVIIDGHSITKEKKEASKRVSWVPELPIFEQDAKALDYFIYLAGYYGIEKEEAKKKAEELFSSFGLLGREKDKLKNYSQGMKKRFVLAVSLLSDPNNFIFDEVLNGLDPQGIMFFRDLAIKLKREKKAILFSSHILSEVESIADRVIFIHKGKIIRQMAMDEIRKFFSSNTFRVTLGRVDNNVIKIAEKYGNPTLQGNTIVIENFNGNITGLSSDLSEYNIIEMSRLEGNLEEVFFKLIGDQK